MRTAASGERCFAKLKAGKQREKGQMDLEDFENVTHQIGSCGAIYPLIGPLVDEMGIDVLNPIQPRAKGMDMARIKHEFGHKLAFHGGIDLQHTLPHGTPAEVQAEVIDRCRVLGNGGGYICTSAHYIQADVSVENVAAMYITPRTVPG